MSSDASVTSVTSGTSVTIPSKSDENFGVVNYIIIGVVIIIVLVIIWFAYDKFMENRNSSDSSKEKENPVADYDLEDEIYKLNQLQNKILKNISQDVGI